MKKQTYLKKNHAYWTAKKLNKYSMKIWYFIIACMALVTVWAVINRQVNKGGLVDPRVSHVVTQVMASEPVVISCEDPKGYLECAVYQGKITWKDHDKLSKIIECESKWNSNAINVNKNGSIDRGIFQINSVHKSLKNEDAFNFKKNIDFGIEMYKKQGVRPWVCSKILNIK